MEEVVGSSPTGYRRNSRDTNSDAHLDSLIGSLRLDR